MVDVSKLAIGQTYYVPAQQAGKYTKATIHSIRAGDGADFTINLSRSVRRYCYATFNRITRTWLTVDEYKASKKLAKL